MNSKIAEVEILVERRPGTLAKSIRAMIGKNWEWDGKVLLSSTDGFIAVFTKSEDTVKKEKAEIAAKAAAEAKAEAARVAKIKTEAAKAAKAAKAKVESDKKDTLVKATAAKV